MDGKTKGHRIAYLGAAMALLTPAHAWGQAQPPSNQPTTNDFAVDLFQGVVFAPTRVTSMGGAYAGMAEGTGGLSANASSPAVRAPTSLTWLDFDLDASLSIPLNLFENDDFDNSGDLDADYSNFIYLAGALQMQAGPFGAGAFGDLQRYELQFPGSEDETFVTVGRYHVLTAVHFFGNQFAVGGGIRALTLSVSNPEAELTVFGVSPQLGFHIRPDWMPFRVGATYRHPVKADFLIGSGESVGEDGLRRAGNLVLPREVVLPWEIEAGVAVQVGARPLNPEWLDPEEQVEELRDTFRARERARRASVRERVAELPPGPARDALRDQLAEEADRADERDRRELEYRLTHLKEERRARAQNWPREALLMTADLLLTGPVDNAIQLERFLGQSQPSGASSGPCRTVASGESVVISPRFGVEVEPFPEWVHTRFGTYYEPQRFTYATPECDDRSGRQHFTFGADVKLLTTTWFGLVPEVTYRLQGFGDLAPRFQSFGLGIGVWH